MIMVLTLQQLTGLRYARILKFYLIPELTQKTRLENIIYRQDGAPPHVHQQVKQILYRHF